MQKVFLAPLLKRHPGPCVLQNTRNGRVLAEHLVAAFDSASRRTGLLSRDTFETGHAMVIAPTNAIHTFFMRFPIDVAFVRRDGQVVKVRHAVPPWRIAGALRGYAVIELPAGTLERCDTAAGDILAIVPASSPDAF